MTKGGEDSEQQFSVKIINGYPKVSSTGPGSIFNGSEAHVSEKIGQRNNSLPNNNGSVDRKGAQAAKQTKKRKFSANLTTGKLAMPFAILSNTDSRYHEGTTRN